MNPGFIEAPGPVYMLVNATMDDAVTTLDESDVWNSMTLRANDSSTYAISAQVTVCMSTFEAQELEIHATRAVKTYQELKSSWDTSKASFNAEAILHQFGASRPNMSNTERGIFNLTPRTWKWRNRPDYVSLTGGSWSTTTALESTNYASRLYSGMISDEQYSLLEQTARVTLNPALALQAYLSNLCAMAYYDRIVMFDTSAPSMQTQMVQVTRPIGWSGYVAVLGVLFCHLLLVMVTLVSFELSGRHGRVGDAWAAVSQVLSATYEWTGDMDDVDDKRVKQWLKERGQNESLVGIESVAGRVQIVKKDKRA
jgi:hypothetical protein